MIGLRFTTGPLCFPGFCSGLKKPSVSSMIFSPDSATLLKISAISLCQRWRQGRNAGGAKTVRVPTASEASKIFTGHTFQIGLKCDYTL